MYSSTSNASVVAVWSFSSSATSPRQKSLEITSNGPKCWRANVVLPEPDTPTSTTRDSSGMRSSRGSVLAGPVLAEPGTSGAAESGQGEHRQLGGRADLGVVRSDRQEAHLVAPAAGHPGRSVAELGAGPLEPVIRVPHLPGAQAGEADVVLGVRRGDHDGAGPGRAEYGLLQRTEPWRVDVLDDFHEDGRVQAGQPLVGVGER